MFEFKLPDLGEGIHEGEVLKWHVQPGDTIAEDAPLVEVETDKAAVTIPSPRGGKVMTVVGELALFAALVLIAGHAGTLVPDRADLVGLSFAWEEREAWYVPCNIEPPVFSKADVKSGCVLAPPEASGNPSLTS